VPRIQGHRQEKYAALCLCRSLASKAAEVHRLRFKMPPMALFTHIKSIVANSCAASNLQVDICSIGRKAAMSFDKVLCPLFREAF